MERYKTNQAPEDNEVSVQDLKNKSKYRTVFIGTPNFCVPFLEAVKNASFLDLKAVITEPDKPAGRGRKLKQSPVADFAENNGIRLFKPDRINSLNKNLIKINPDVLIVVAYGQIISKDILNISKYGTINVHPSDLPKYRGASPIQTVLLNGKDNTAISIMKMDEKMDHGPILDKFDISIDQKDDYFSLEKKILSQGPDFLIKTLKKYLNRKISPKEQDDNLASYTKLIKKSDGQIDWNKPPYEIHNKIRAYCAWPKAFTFLNNGKRLLILKSKYENKKIKLIQIQLEGKKSTNWDDFINGNKKLIPQKMMDKID